MNAFNRKCRFSGYASSETPWPIFKKKLAQLITSWTPRHMQVLESIGSRGRVCACVKLVPSGVYFLRFNAPRYRSAVGPIVVVNGSNDASSWPSRPFMVSLIKKKYFPFLTRKCEKLHYTLWELWTAVTLASLKIRTSCLHRAGGFRGRAIEWCHSILPQTDPCCHGNQS